MIRLSVIYVFILLPRLAVSFVTHRSHYRVASNSRVDGVRSTVLASPQTPISSFVLWATSSPNENVAQLRAAAQKAREEADRLSRELGKQVEPRTGETAKKSSSTKEEVLALVKEQDWQQLSQRSQYFGSANLRTFPVSLNLLEQRTGLTASVLGLAGETNNADLDDLKWATVIVALGSGGLGIAALALLPPNIGATVCYLVALVPIAFLGVGSTAPGLILGAIQGIKSKKSGGENNDAGAITARERVVRHEAAHLCCGYWCGLPVQSYTVNDSGAQVEFGSLSPPPYSASQVAALAVTGLSGLVAEGLCYGTAKGATNDLLTIDRVLRQGKDFYGAQAQQDLTRWAALTAATLLKQNQEKYEKVVQAMSTQTDLFNCIAILEQ